MEKVSFLSEGQKIAGILHLPNKMNPPCVIASHGLLSSKESEKYVTLGERMSSEGMAMLRFDFRGIGASEGKLEDDSVSRRMADLSSAIGFVKSYPGMGGNRVGLLGSSLGGYVSLIGASMEKGIAAVVVWATPFHLDDLGSKKQGEDYPLPGKAFFEDLPRHRLLPLLPEVINCLVIHGDRDELVPVDQAWEIFHALGAPKEIHVIEEGDHRLTNLSHRQRAIELSVG
ncbi:MAG TPA: YqiA/YcfP family alpha/beta fold hydrolase, partial [Thermodesulfobacteriota bacterium]|nr:YqiA/YcfP family alpha/beta fold hydrolase [Thermodesulfobacteriota bacterium]